MKGTIGFKLAALLLAVLMLSAAPVSALGRPETKELSALAQAMNAEGCTLDYVNDEVNPWIPYEYEGELVGRSAVIDLSAADPANGYVQTSTISATVYMEAGDVISFDYRVSSEEGCDFFNFFINDTGIIFATGIRNWQSFTYYAPESSTYTFVWEYRQDDDYAEGDDCVYVKNIYCSAAVGGSEPDPVLGDADCDGYATFSDVALLYGYILGLYDIPEQGRLNTDMNGDGQSTFNDVAGLYQYILGAE